MKPGIESASTSSTAPDSTYQCTHDDTDVDGVNHDADDSGGPIHKRRRVTTAPTTTTVTRVTLSATMSTTLARAASASMGDATEVSATANDDGTLVNVNVVSRSTTLSPTEVCAAAAAALMEALPGTTPAISTGASIPLALNPGCTSLVETSPVETSPVETTPTGPPASVTVSHIPHIFQAICDHTCPLLLRSLSRDALNLADGTSPRHLRIQPIDRTAKGGEIRITRTSVLPGGVGVEIRDLPDNTWTADRTSRLPPSVCEARVVDVAGDFLLKDYAAGLSRLFAKVHTVRILFHEGTVAYTAPIICNTLVFEEDLAMPAQCGALLLRTNTSVEKVVFNLCYSLDGPRSLFRGRPNLPESSSDIVLIFTLVDADGREAHRRDTSKRTKYELDAFRTNMHFDVFRRVDWIKQIPWEVSKTYTLVDILQVPADRFYPRSTVGVPDQMTPTELRRLIANELRVELVTCYRPPGYDVDEWLAKNVSILSRDEYHASMNSYQYALETDLWQ